MRYKDDIIAEVRRNREELLHEHGGVEGYLAYLRAQHFRWEAEGFHVSDFGEKGLSQIHSGQVATPSPVASTNAN